MKRSNQTLSLAALLAVGASAQSTTIINNTSDSAVVTSYFSTCPVDTTTTVTLSTTTTLCPGPQCGAPTPIWAPKPVTTVGPDGKTTIYEQTPYTAPCPCPGGICDAVYTVTRPCPCNAPWMPTAAMPGFTTTTVACHACAQNGGPSTVTIVTPMPNGPSATQTPVMGTPYNGAYASAGASAYVSVGPNGAVASAGANAQASANGDYAAASANANASASAGNGSSGASASAIANADAGSMSASTSTNMTPPLSSVSPTSPVATYKGSAERAVYAVSAILAGVVGSLAVLL